MKDHLKKMMIKKGVVEDQHHNANSIEESKSSARGSNANGKKSKMLSNAA